MPLFVFMQLGVILIHAYIPSLVGKASPVLETLLPLKFGQGSKKFNRLESAHKIHASRD